MTFPLTNQEIDFLIEAIDIWENKKRARKDKAILMKAKLIGMRPQKES